MSCTQPSPIFFDSFSSGMKLAAPLPDGYSVYCNWENAVASQMTPVIYDVTNVFIDASPSRYKLKASGKILRGMGEPIQKVCESSFFFF